MAEIMVIVGVFLLRLGLPLVITFAVGYWLRHLDAKWQAEAQSKWEADDPAQKEIVGILQSLNGQQYCRKEKQYKEIRRALDPDCALLDIPCWVARLRAIGELPEECHNCELFAASLAN